jgi:acyl-ACP thioesterase
VQSYDFVPEPALGRVWVHEGLKARLGDVTPGARLRLDALARYLQDAATDDSEDAFDFAGEEAGRAWVIRRLAIDVERLPAYGESFSVRTWCSGIGARWAERRSDIVLDGKVGARAAAIWVHIDTSLGRPQPLPPRFDKVYGEAAGGREASQRLRLPGPVSAGQTRTVWPLRATDFDVLGHVNNAAYLHALEQLLAAKETTHRRIQQVEVEWRAGIDPGEHPELIAGDTGPEVRGWLLVGNDVRAALFARVGR